MKFTICHKIFSIRRCQRLQQLLSGFSVNWTVGRLQNLKAKKLATKILLNKLNLHVKIGLKSIWNEFFPLFFCFLYLSNFFLFFIFICRVESLYWSDSCVVALARNILDFCSLSLLFHDRLVFFKLHFSLSRQVQPSFVIFVERNRLLSCFAGTLRHTTFDELKIQIWTKIYQF